MKKHKVENFIKDISALIKKHFVFIKAKGFNKLKFEITPPELNAESESIDYKLVISVELYSLPEIYFFDKKTKKKLIRDTPDIIKIKNKHQKRIFLIDLSKRNFNQLLNDDYVQYQMNEIEQVLKLYANLVKKIDE